MTLGSFCRGGSFLCVTPAYNMLNGNHFAFVVFSCMDWWPAGLAPLSCVGSVTLRSNVSASPDPFGFVRVSLGETFNPFPNTLWFLRVCSTCHLKTRREKEKLLVTSNFSFSHSVFYPFWKTQPFLSSLELLCANSFSLEGSKTLSFGKELIALA